MLPLVGGQGGLQPTRNLGVQLTLLQPGGADYAHNITACPPEFENLMASLNANLKKISPQSATAQSGQNILHKVHPKIICHLPPCLIGSGLS